MGAFPEGHHALLASQEGSETFLYPPTQLVAGPEAGGSGQPKQPEEGEGRGQVLGGAKAPPLPDRKKPATTLYGDPNSDLIWEAGSGSCACSTSLHPNLVLGVAQTQWREGSASQFCGRSLPSKGPRRE